ncbi:MAG: arginine deiminase family protein [Rhodospirillales bacterium]
MPKDGVNDTIPLQRRNPKGGTAPLEDWGINSEYGLLHDVLLGPVETFGPMDNAGFSSIYRDTERRGLHWDHQAAMKQYREMTDAYTDAGVTIHTLPADGHLSYGLYARDSSFMTPWGAVITQMANPRRRGEYATAIRFYLEAGIPIYDMVSAGSFEGGDFHIVEPGAVLIGYTGLRCEEVSAKQIGGWMEKEGWEVKYAPIDPFYVHIDLMVCMIADKCAAVCLDTTPDDVVDWLKQRKIEIVPVGFKDTMALGCNVMSLGNERVLSPLCSKDLNTKLRALGFKVYDPDMSMITMMGGGIHCMAQSLRRDPV